MNIYKEIVKDQRITLDQFRDMYIGTLDDIKKQGTKLTPKVKEYAFYIVHLYFNYYNNCLPTGATVSEYSVKKVLGDNLTEEDMTALSELCNTTFDFLHIPLDMSEYYYKSLFGDWQTSGLGRALHRMIDTQPSLYTKYLKELAIELHPSMNELTRQFISWVSVVASYCMRMLYKPLDNIEVCYKGNISHLINGVENLCYTSTMHDNSGIEVWLADTYTLFWKDFGVFSDLVTLKRLIPEAPDYLIEKYIYKPVKGTTSDKRVARHA